jgi:hypothetical protein
LPEVATIVKVASPAKLKDTRSQGTRRRWVDRCRRTPASADAVGNEEQVLVEQIAAPRTLGRLAQMGLEFAEAGHRKAWAAAAILSMTLVKCFSLLSAASVRQSDIASKVVGD